MIISRLYFKIKICQNLTKLASEKVKNIVYFQTKKLKKTKNYFNDKKLSKKLTES